LTAVGEYSPEDAPGGSASHDSYSPRLVLFDKAGKARLELGVAADDVPSVVLSDSNGQRAIELTLGSTAAINLYSKDLHVISLSASPESVGGLTIRGPRLGSETFLGTKVDSSPGLNVYHEGVPRVVLGSTVGVRLPSLVDARPVSSLLLVDAGGQIVQRLPE
jgi:hypothetical protein